MKIIISLYLILLIVLVILSLIIIKHQENLNQKYCQLLVKNKIKTNEIKDFIESKHNDVLNKKFNFEQEYSNIKSIRSIAGLATFVCMYVAYREDLLLSEIESFIKEQG